MNAIQERLNELRQENADLKAYLNETQVQLAQLQELVDVLKEDNRELTRRLEMLRGTKE